MSLECVRKYGAPSVEKNTTGSFLIWTQTAYPVTLPWVSSLLTSLCVTVCLSPSNLQLNCQLLKAVEISCLSVNHKCLRMKSAYRDFSLCCPLSLLQGNKGKTGVIIAAYMHYSKISAGWVCPCLCGIQGHTLIFSCSSEYPHMEHIQDY